MRGRDPVVMLPGLDAFRVQALLDRGALLLGDADPGVRRRVALGMHAKPVFPRNATTGCPSVLTMRAPKTRS